MPDTLPGESSPIGSPYWRTEVAAHENSDSPYGTFDQGGNVREWNETVISTLYRGFRGGSWDFSANYLLPDAGTRRPSPANGTEEVAFGEGEEGMVDLWK